MNSLENYTKFMNESAQNAFVPILSKDFGETALFTLSNMTDCITQIYKNLRLRDFSSVTVFAPLENDLVQIEIPQNYVEVVNVETFATVKCDHLVIQVLDGQISYFTDWELQVDLIRDKAIIYKLSKNNEVFFGKTEVAILPNLPDAESYFQHPTFKDLEEAFEEYEQKRAKHSSCPFLLDVWHSKNRIFFVPGPESILRDSLHDFLSIRLRGSPEVMPEQNVDKSHPIDIKVTWKYSSHIALIEVKWVGKSYDPIKKKLTSKTDYHANKGAKQLVDYLVTNKGFAFTKIVSGYLVVFDGRRRNTNEKSIEITAKNGGYYRNQSINYKDNYNESRNDFEKPRSFFMEPNVV